MQTELKGDIALDCRKAGLIAGAGGGALRRSRRHLLPPAAALRNIRVIPRRIRAVIPILRCHKFSCWRKFVQRRLVRIRIGSDRSRIEIPRRPDEPPPSKSAGVSPVIPMPATPALQIMLVKTPDVAMPARAVTAAVVCWQGRHRHRCKPDDREQVLQMSRHSFLLAHSPG